MKASNLVALALGTGLCVGLYACGGDGTHTVPAQLTPPAPPATVMLSVNDVYGLAKSKSETDDPMPVNGGSVTGSDETSDPMSID
jgi:hypothetical protein